MDELNNVQNPQDENAMPQGAPVEQKPEGMVEGEAAAPEAQA